MQTLVSVALGHREPVAHAARVALVHVGDDAECLPAVQLFAFGCRVDDDAYGEEIIHSVYIYLLLLHLLPDGVDALGASLHVEFQARFDELFLDGLGEAGYICIAALLGGIEFLLYIIVGIVLQIFEAQVLELALEFVESQFMGQRCIQVSSLHRHLLLRFGVACTLDVAHEAHAVGYHDENHAHVFGHRYQQAAEVFALDGCTLLIQIADAQESVHDAGHLVAKVAPDVFQRHIAPHHGAVEQHTQHRPSCRSHLLSHDERRLHIGEDVAQSECVARHTMLAR